jgi:hypothetical protein
LKRSHSELSEPCAVYFLKTSLGIDIGKTATECSDQVVLVLSLALERGLVYPVKRNRENNVVTASVPRFSPIAFPSALLCSSLRALLVIVVASSYSSYR